MIMHDRIVAEVTRHWTLADNARLTRPLISQQFEKVIAANALEGFTLESWQFASTRDAAILTETIIAVFIRRTAV